MNWYLFAGYAAAASLCAFFAFGWDKRCAVRGKWRVRERTLLALAAAGGAAGALLGMYVFRHKIRKNKFRFGVPALLILQAGILCLLRQLLC